jgi:hypothetical protein
VSRFCTVPPPALGTDVRVAEGAAVPAVPVPPPYDGVPNGRGGADTADVAGCMVSGIPSYAGGSCPLAAPPGTAVRTLGSAGPNPDGTEWVARSYRTPACGWHTIWRTLANPGESSQGSWAGVTVN